MGGSQSNGGISNVDPFDDAAKRASDRVYSETKDNSAATAAAVAEYSKKAFYDSGSDGPIPDTGTVGGNIFDAVVEAYDVYKNSKQESSKRN